MLSGGARQALLLGVPRCSTRHRFPRFLFLRRSCKAIAFPAATTHRTKHHSGATNSNITTLLPNTCTSVVTFFLFGCHEENERGLRRQRRRRVDPKLPTASIRVGKIPPVHFFPTTNRQGRGRLLYRDSVSATDKGPSLTAPSLATGHQLGYERFVG
ncbi:hypothetical protein B0T25DRAFT_360142 [Lasiosphaeria hispida]|uniref:Uncharacterized protein n=1 Tax=Lasiosphaeria hispida TaxID=260671 RepID=A0AAJ0H7S7_9PEZI|nr:hypothetical protein B0T25DRAFT_360142 [Lasiosphaeria hispida]